MPEPEPKVKAQRDPQALSTEYHKARKQLMLWAGILFIWALVGIDLEKAQEAGGNTGALIKSIKSPQAVPWVLLIMVGYFLFKLRIEWLQCNKPRRQVLEAKMDYYSACIVSAAAIILYVGQTISRVQIADTIRSNAGASWSLFWGFLIFLTMILLVKFLMGTRLGRRRHLTKFSLSFVWIIETLGAFFMLKVAVALFGHDVQWRFALIGVFIGSTVAFMTILLPYIYRRRAGMSKA